MKIELTHEQIDHVVVKELTRVLQYELSPPNNVFETLEKRLEMIYSTMEVIRIFTIKEERDRIHAKLKTKKKIKKLKEYYKQTEE